MNNEYPKVYCEKSKLQHEQKVFFKLVLAPTLYSVCNCDLEISAFKVLLFLDIKKRQVYTYDTSQIAKIAHFLLSSWDKWKMNHKVKRDSPGWTRTGRRCWLPGTIPHNRAGCVIPQFCWSLYPCSQQQPPRNLTSGCGGNQEKKVFKNRTTTCHFGSVYE